MRNTFSHIILTIALCMTMAHTAFAQTEATTPDKTRTQGTDSLAWLTDTAAVPAIYIPAIDRPDFDSIISHPSRVYSTMPLDYFTMMVYGDYQSLPDLTLKKTERDSNFAEAFQWIDDYRASDAVLRHVYQNTMLQDPYSIKYNAAYLPEKPPLYTAFVDPTTMRIEFAEQKVTEKPTGPETVRKNWLHKFNASLQFSQAYISPNWYKGGNSHLNMMGQLMYNLKLNTKFYPNYLFDMTAQYKLSLNSTPEDSIRSYNISEDLFQFNLTAGLKAYKKWYYSTNITFKTQIFNRYPANSREMRSAFMSPGELNVGLGMTYNTTNKKKTFTLGMSISPVSWNLKTVLNNRIDPVTYGLETGRKTLNNIGSSFECNYSWKMAWNVTYRSRIFAFTDYSYVYGDWEHTFDFAINRYFSTQLYVHMRYDTRTQRQPDTRWHKFQLQEVLSFGFSYTIGTI